jgi:D-alanyl-lipoteichoic acid acyltransferase DltB (MBOAT superfamily)
VLFPSIEFAIFFAIVLSANWALSALRLETLRKWLLLLASLGFYAFWSIGFALLLVAVSAVAYAVGRVHEATSNPGRRKLALWLGIGGALGLLAYFKYYNFALATLVNAGLFNALGLQPAFSEVVVPIAISFFTFHAISYMVDGYFGRMVPTRSLRDVTLYISFFPHLVAGPIVRAADFIPQIEANPRTTARPYSAAMALIVGGLFKKVVLANYLAVAIVDPVFIAPSQFAGGDILLAVFAYAFQIYFDFSAYTDIAIGVAALLGYRFPENFNQPYRSLSPREFWTRWHISLSTWLRDYLYIPLGGSRHGMVRTILALMATMVLGGLWHGANFTFMLWGTLHGLALVANHLWAKTSLRQSVKDQWLYRALCLIAMTVFILATWVFFRSPDLATAGEIFGGIAQRLDMPTLLTPFLAALLVIGILTQFLPSGLRIMLSGSFMRVPLSLQIVGLTLAMIVLLLLAPTAAAPFIYFQF